MKKTFQQTGLIFLLIIVTNVIRAEIKLPAIFGDHMVLQQQTDAAIWGEASPGKTVRIKTSWDKKSYSTKSDKEGDWKVSVRTPLAGGPYEITISDGEVLKLKDILIGEVWICSGQSNMQMPMKGGRNQPIIGANEIIAISTNPSIRMITVQREKSLVPKDDITGDWKECIPKNVANFSATAYFFGKMLQQVLGVPVGLICSSWGGTRIEPWMSENSIEKFNWLSLPDINQQGLCSKKPQSPTVIYNAMIHPLVGYAIKGAIWYQGEANRNEPDKYEKLLPGLAEGWRKEWGIGDFPFYYAQIAPYDYGGIHNSAYMRDAQRKAENSSVNMGMACLLDCGEKDCIHPSNKKAAGDRLAYLALVKTYGKKGFECSGPTLKEMTTEKSMVNLTFNHATNGLTCYGKELENFEIAGKNKRFYPAKAAITKQGISLFSPNVKEPVAVRYAFKDFVIGDLFNTEGLPASSFRTDDW